MFFLFKIFIKLFEFCINYNQNLIPQKTFIFYGVNFSKLLINEVIILKRFNFIKFIYFFLFLETCRFRH